MAGVASSTENVGTPGAVTSEIRKYMAFLGSRARGAMKRRGDPAYYRRLAKRGWRVRRSRIAHQPPAQGITPDRKESSDER